MEPLSIFRLITAINKLKKRQILSSVVYGFPHTARARNAGKFIGGPHEDSNPRPTDFSVRRSMHHLATENLFVSQVIHYFRKTLTTKLIVTG